MDVPVVNNAFEISMCIFFSRSNHRSEKMGGRRFADPFTRRINVIITAINMLARRIRGEAVFYV